MSSNAFAFQSLDNAVGQYDQATLMTRVIDHDVPGPVAGEHILPGHSGKMQLQSRLHLRQVGGSGNITSFSCRNKVFVPVPA